MTWQPEQTVEIIAGTPPGGGQDRAAHAIASALEPFLPFPIVVSNLSGRGGGNAWDALVARRGDPHVVSISSPTLVTNRLLGIAETDYQAVRALANLYTEYILFAVPSASPIQTPKDLATALGSGRPPTTSFATERGNVNHIALARVARSAGGDPATLPIRVFESARHAVADMLTGHAEMVAVSAPSAVPEFTAGTLRPIAVSAPERIGTPFHATHTWAESGVDATIGTWRGLIGPPGLEVEHLNFWARALDSAIATDGWREALDRHGWADSFLDPAATMDFFAAEEQHMRVALTELDMIR